MQKMIWVPKDLIDEMERRAKFLGLSFSSFLVGLYKEKYSVGAGKGIGEVAVGKEKAPYAPIRSDDSGNSDSSSSEDRWRAKVKAVPKK